MSDVESNDSESTGATGRMPPRARSAYHPARTRAGTTTTTGLPPSGDSGSSLESGASGGAKRRSLRPNQSFSSGGGSNISVRRRASFAALPSADKPAFRRGMSVVPSNRHTGQNTITTRGTRNSSTFHTRRSSTSAGAIRTPAERAFAEEIRAQRLAKQQKSISEANGTIVGEDGEIINIPRGEVCGMCGSCAEGDKALPPWAPEKLAKLSSEQKEIVLMDMRAKEESGKIARELRLLQLERANNNNINNNSDNTPNGNGNSSYASSINDIPGATPPLRRPAPKRQSTRLSVALAPGNNSDARRAREAARAARIVEIEAQQNNNNNNTNVTNNRGALAGQNYFNNNTNNTTVSDDDDDFGLNLGVQIVSMDSEDNKKNSINNSELEELGAVSSTASSSTEEESCDECDALESRLKDLEEQLGVLRNVVKASSRGNDTNTNSNNAWHERVLGTFAGAPPGSETYKLKEEVGALRKATNTLFSKLQDSDSKRAANKVTINNSTSQQKSSSNNIPPNNNHL